MNNPNTPLTMADLKAKVQNYRNFAAKETKPEDVFMSAVFNKNVVQQILDSTPDEGGVRIYMAKHSDSDLSHDVSYLLVPVTKQAEGLYTDMIDDDNAHMQSGLLAMTDCIGKLCNGSALI